MCWPNQKINGTDGLRENVVFFFHLQSIYVLILVEGSSQYHGLGIVEFITAIFNDLRCQIPFRVNECRPIDTV
jgi:hypothetical protein